MGRHRPVSIQARNAEWRRENVSIGVSHATHHELLNAGSGLSRARKTVPRVYRALTMIERPAVLCAVAVDNGGNVGDTIAIVSAHRYPVTAGVERFSAKWMGRAIPRNQCVWIASRVARKLAIGPDFFPDPGHGKAGRAHQ